MNVRRLNQMTESFHFLQHKIFWHNRLKALPIILHKKEKTSVFSFTIRQSISVKQTYCWQQTAGTPLCSFPCDTQHRQTHKHMSCQSLQLQKAVLSRDHSGLQTPGAGQRAQDKTDALSVCMDTCNFRAGLLSASKPIKQLLAEAVYSLVLFLLTDLSSFPSVPAGHDEMCWQLLLVLIGDVPHQSGSWANLGVLTYLNTDIKTHKRRSCKFMTFIYAYILKYTLYIIIYMSCPIKRARVKNCVPWGLRLTLSKKLCVSI